MTRPPRLTSLARAAVSAVLKPGARAVDATMGNGHDTLMLARCIAPTGQVAAFDIQRQALQQTAVRLRAAGLAQRVDLMRLGHEHMIEALPDDWPGTVAAVMFNLGYLPGGDKTRITRAETTVPAMRQSLALLAPGGILSVMLYRGHRGADAETTAVADWIARLDGWQVDHHPSPGPWLYLIRGDAAAHARGDRVTLRADFN